MWLNVAEILENNNEQKSFISVFEVASLSTQLILFKTSNVPTITSCRSTDDNNHNYLLFLQLLKSYDVSNPPYFRRHSQYGLYIIIHLKNINKYPLIAFFFPPEFYF